MCIRDRTFPAFVAHGGGPYKIRTALTIDSINQTLPALSEFASQSAKNIQFENQVMQFYSQKDNYLTSELGEIFKKNGSDKSTTHDYYKIYAYLISSLVNPKKIFEIGLGTNNVDIVSSMGIYGTPGASLRSFRDFTKEAFIYGADFDRRILFEEIRIKTFFVDQTKNSTFTQLNLSLIHI